MRLKKDKNILYAPIIGSIIVAIILLAGTYWTGRSASRDTHTAVRNVSLFYLDELAGRREQVISSTLEDYISDIDVAISLLEKDDLKDIPSLQSFQLRMKQLYDLEKFAFVNEEGLIYTSRGTRTDIDLYSFDPKTISNPEVSLKKEGSNDYKVVVAAPVDHLSFDGHTLVASFMEIDLSHMLDTLSFQSGSNSTTFCNLYTTGGTSLTDAVLGGLSSDENLLDAIGAASLDEGYDLSRFKQDFAEKKKGVVSFTYEGVKATLCYVPVHHTDWMLTYLIRESVISDQIAAISDGIIRRGLFQSALTALVLIFVFTILIIQTMKTAKLAMEHETAEVMQLELEERIALQDELLDQEKARAQQDQMITALASDYRSVYYVDLDNDDGICYRADHRMKDGPEEGNHFKFSTLFGAYAANHVAEEYRNGFLDFIKPENIRKALLGEAIIAYRYLAVCDGKERYEMLRMAGVRHVDDRTDGMIHAVGVGFTDIDAMMRDSMAKNQALSDALETAKEANKAKTVFLSNMSHEIRTPMNAIIGLDSLALNEPDLSDTVKDYLEKIGSSAQHLLSLINDILDISRIESGRMVIHNEEFAFSKLMEQINIIFSGQCSEKGLDYECHILGQLSDYYIGDSTKLRQILINILGNAVKFTEPGGRIDFIIEKTAGFDGKSTLRFVIKDTGIGMSSDFLPRLFDTFAQENDGATNKYGSSGLGMAITKNIVELMNGEIAVESEKGKGTTFTVTLTLIDSAKKQLPVEKDVEIIPGELSVLVVDDDPVACDHARLVLGRDGIEVETALSGAEALDKVKLRHARRNPYNLIIVDWKMPEMDGVETSKRIRSIIGGGESAIILLTAYNWEDILEDAADAGVDSFVSKPLFSGNILEEYKSTLKKRSIISSGPTVRAELSGRRVLLAEDMDINAQIIIKLLEMRHVETDYAKNGREAVELFTSHPEGHYDAILMDMRMPEMDGLEATRQIRALDRPDSSTIPIVALTANAFDEDVQRSLQAGLNAHLSKPIQADVLFDTLEQLIRA